MDRPRREMLDHVANKKNLCLGLGRQGIAVQDPVWSLVAISKYPVDANIFRRGGINVFPLWLYTQEGKLSLEKYRPNFSRDFESRLANALGAKELADGGLPAGFMHEQVIHYAFGIFHSLAYRVRYAEFLKIDFPRLPLPGSLDLFHELAGLGGELVALHLMESPKLNRFITTYNGPRNPEVGRVGWSDDIVWLDAAAAKKGQLADSGTIGFRGVPEGVWNFHIGGYQVCEKWLKDRKGRTLSKDDITHYQKIVVALAETIRLMKEIDEVIEAHGGWPGAFQGGSSTGVASPRVVEATG
jgi:predicted helicase